jgi:hypothetical protein
VATKFGLTGDMIPRSVKRIFDQRSEQRIEPTADRAVLECRGLRVPVELINVSGSGAMIRCDLVPCIGERVRLQLLDHPTAEGFVRWVRDGRFGINFNEPLRHAES